MLIIKAPTAYHSMTELGLGSEATWKKFQLPLTSYASNVAASAYKLLATFENCTIGHTALKICDTELRNFQLLRLGIRPHEEMEISLRSPTSTVHTPVTQSSKFTAPGPPLGHAS